MKKQIFILVLLCLSAVTYSQSKSFTFPAYNLRNHHTIMPVPDELKIIKSPGGVFTIRCQAGGDYFILSSIRLEEKHMGKYYYLGNKRTSYGAHFQTTIVTEIDLEEFLRGVGSDGYHNSRSKYEIKIYYDLVFFERYGLEIDRYRFNISVFPIKSL